MYAKKKQLRLYFYTYISVFNGELVKENSFQFMKKWMELISLMVFSHVVYWVYKMYDDVAVMFFDDETYVILTI